MQPDPARNGINGDGPHETVMQSTVVTKSSKYAVCLHSPTASLSLLLI